MLGWIFQVEPSVLMSKITGNKDAQHHKDFSKWKQGCVSPNLVETSLLNIRKAFPSGNKAAQAQI